jgi:hypothetical protein
MVRSRFAKPFRKFEVSPDVTDILQHVNAYDHMQCARKGSSSIKSPIM